MLRCRATRLRTCVVASVVGDGRRGLTEGGVKVGIGFASGGVAGFFGIGDGGWERHVEFRDLPKYGCYELRRMMLGMMWHSDWDGVPSLLEVFPCYL